MHTSETPPSRKSILATGDVKLVGPHQVLTCSASLHAFQTRSTGTSKVRVNVKSLVFSFCALVFAARSTRTMAMLKLNLAMSSFLCCVALHAFRVGDEQADG